MEENKTELVEVGTTDMVEVNNVTEPVETTDDGGLGLGGIILIGAAVVGGGLLTLKKMGKIPSKEERMIKKLEKQGYSVYKDTDFDDDAVDAEAEEVEKEDSEEESTEE